MHSNYSLNPGEISFFCGAGYLRLPGSIDDELRYRILQKVSEYYADGMPPSKKLYGFYQRTPELTRSLLAQPALRDPLLSLLGPNVVLVLNRHNNAALNPPGTQPRLHRDVLHWTRPLVTAIVYLEESTVGNGCTYVVPTSRNLPFVGITQPGGGGTWMDEHEEYARVEHQQVPVPMVSGSILLLDSLTFHSVGANSSGHTRASLTFGFRAADELDIRPDSERQVIAYGEFTYRGNDR